MPSKPAMSCNPRITPQSKFDCARCARNRRAGSALDPAQTVTDNLIRRALASSDFCAHSQKIP